MPGVSTFARNYLFAIMSIYITQKRTKDKWRAKMIHVQFIHIYTIL